MTARPDPLGRDRVRVGVVCVLYGQQTPPTLVGLLATRPEVAVVVVDNSGDLRTGDATADVHVERPGRNLGYPEGVNLGLRALPDDPDVLVILNPDVEGSPAVILDLARAVSACAEPTLAAPASALGMYGLQPYPTVTATLVSYGLRRERRRTSGTDGYLSGAVLLLNRGALAVLAVEGKLLDEDLFFMDDVELTDRARRSGVAVVELPVVDSLVHVGGLTMRRRPAVRVYFGRVSVVRYWRRRSRAAGALLTLFFVIESTVGMALALVKRQRHDPPGGSVFAGLRWTVIWLLTRRTDIDARVLG